MNRNDLVKRVRSITRDLSNSIFRETDIIDNLNEGIDRFRQYIPELEGLTYLTSGEQIPELLPEMYHHLLALYSASRCFAQDERHYQATNYMNEFETKIDEFKGRVEAGEIVIKNPDGTDVAPVYNTDYVVDNYFTKNSGLIDSDDGVEGVE